jgi:hypothetical protein
MKRYKIVLHVEGIEVADDEEDALGQFHDTLMFNTDGDIMQAASAVLLGDNEDDEV